MSTYGNTPTFNRQKICLVKAPLRVQTRLEVATAALRSRPVSEFCPCRPCKRISTTTSRSRLSCFPSTRPRLCGKLAYAEQHLLCLERIIGTSIVTITYGTRKPCGEVHIVLNKSVGNTWSRIAPGTHLGVGEWGKSPLSNSQGEIAPAQNRWLASRSRSLSWGQMRRLGAVEADGNAGESWG